MNGSTPDPLGTPYCEGSHDFFVTRCADQVVPPSVEPRYVMSNSVLPVQLRSLDMRSMRPDPGSMLISTLMRSPADGETICGAVHEESALTSADVRRIC